MRKQAIWFLILLIMIPFAGCESGGERALGEFRKRNETNVAKVRTCIIMYSSRNGGKSPKSKEDLVEFLSSGKVDRNLERIGIDPSNLEEIFVSERDSEPLKVRWGAKLGINADVPVAFESVGVDGVRLVAAGEIIEVTSDEQYEALWNGDYTPASEQPTDDR